VNPILLFYLFVGAFVLWILLAWAFPKIGDVIKSIFNDVNEIINEEDEENEEEDDIHL